MKMVHILCFFFKVVGKVIGDCYIFNCGSLFTRAKLRYFEKEEMLIKIQDLSLEERLKSSEQSSKARFS